MPVSGSNNITPVSIFDAAMLRSEGYHKKVDEYRNINLAIEGGGFNSFLQDEVKGMDYVNDSFKRNAYLFFSVLMILFAFSSTICFSYLLFMAEKIVVGDVFGLNIGEHSWLLYLEYLFSFVFGAVFLCYFLKYTLFDMRDNNIYRNELVHECVRICNDMPGFVRYLFNRHEGLKQVLIYSEKCERNMVEYHVMVSGMEFEEGIKNLKNLITFRMKHVCCEDDSRHDVVIFIEDDKINDKFIMEDIIPQWKLFCVNPICISYLEKRGNFSELFEKNSRVLFFANRSHFSEVV